MDKLDDHDNGDDNRREIRQDLERRIAEALSAFSIEDIKRLVSELEMRSDL